MAAVTVVGSLNLDLRLGTAHLPDRGETVIAATESSHPGGKGANQAAAAAALSPNVTMIGRVGTDPAAEILVADLAARGVDTSHIARIPGPTGTAIVVVEERTGENLIIVSPGANAALEPRDVEVAALQAARVVLLQLEVPMHTVLAAARAATGQVVLNPAPVAPLSPELLSCVDVLVPNQWELSRLTDIELGGEFDEAAVEVAARRLGARNVIVTLGGHGAMVVPAGGESELIPPPPVSVVDTTGAGDCFCGALSVALAQGESLIEAARFAVTAAALSTTSQGARGHLPTMDTMRTSSVHPATASSTSSRLR